VSSPRIEGPRSERTDGEGVIPLAAYLRRLRANAVPTRPRSSNVAEAGSGTSAADVSGIWISLKQVLGRTSPRTIELLVSVRDLLQARVVDADVEHRAVADHNRVRRPVLDCGLGRPMASALRILVKRLANATAGRGDLSRCVADHQHLTQLRRGAVSWNAWRLANPGVRPDLSGADLRDADLSSFNLREAMLRKANLARSRTYRDNDHWTDLTNADLTEAYLVNADWYGATLEGADLSKATLCDATLDEAVLINAKLDGAWLDGASMNMTRCNGASFVKAELFLSAAPGADFVGADFTSASLHAAWFPDADMSGANLTSASLIGAVLTDVNLSGAVLHNCDVYGVSAWRVDLTGASQSDLNVSDYNSPRVTVDNLAIAQLVDLLIRNEQVRHVIDTVSTKMVLILGNFAPQRKAILDQLRDRLRALNLVPMMFDFACPARRDLTETISTLAHIARCIIVDLTDAKGVCQELKHVVPQLPSVSVLPLVASGSEVYAMFEHLTRYPWVQPILEYSEHGPFDDMTFDALSAFVERPSRRRKRNAK
jgi:uncharacterized protein YjbI with pentapeptide repeats